MSVDFEPYLTYCRNVRGIGEFELLTKLAYGITRQLLFRFPKEAVSVENPPSGEAEDISFTPADVEVVGVKDVCEWLSLSAFASRLGVAPDEVARRVQCGDLGPVRLHPETGETHLVWPPGYAASEGAPLPEIGKKKVVFTVEATGMTHFAFELDDASAFEKTQRAFLAMAHGLGEPEEVAQRGERLLYRACLIQHWAVFEVFLRGTAHEMMRRHPEVLGLSKRLGKLQATFRDLLELSRGFASVEELRRGLVDSVVQGREDAESVNGVINFLKDEFKFREEPYEAAYMLRGSWKKTGYTDLTELREVRNALMHAPGATPDDLAAQYASVRVCDGAVVVDGEYYLRAQLILDAIAYHLADGITKGHYEVRCGKGED